MGGCKRENDRQNRAITLQFEGHTKTATWLLVYAYQIQPLGCMATGIKIWHQNRIRMGLDL